VFLDYTPDQRALRAELRAYFAEMLTPEVKEKLGVAGEGSDLFRVLVRKMGQDGWLGLGWPKEYGGQGRSAMDQYIMFDEVQRSGAPFPFVMVTTMGPSLMRFGTPEQKAKYLPRMLNGDLNFAVGYTEPGSGTDLASLRTSAVLDGDEWVINGNKVFTSGANQADFIWLACRTDPDLPKHKGISIILVPTSSPGFRWTPLRTVGDVMTTATYYQDVRVPKGNLVGERGGGWSMITTQLNHERVGLSALGGRCWQLWGEVREWARATPLPDADEQGLSDGAVVADVPWVRADLARAYARLDVMKLMNWRMTADIAADNLNPADSSAVKFYGTETHVEVYRLLLGILGAGGWLRPGSPGAALSGEVERMARAAQINTFGGGVNEVQREIVAAAGLKMARRAR
jgi:alkylation response protein AidB-like acyl-CoA dehydrogenase